jgi:drug/metabolite transporter (DMT)-like permease
LLLAIWNTNAFFAYVVSVKLFKLQWEPKRLLAVVLATLGTFAVVYGGVAVSKEPPIDGIENKSSAITRSVKPSAPLLGDLLSLLASFACGLYTVLYKMYAALPTDPEVVAERCRYQELPEDEERLSLVASSSVNTTDAVYPPPFGLHPNLLTSVMGVITFAILWIPLPFLHWSGAEVFRGPPDMWTALSIGGIGLSGMCFNAGYMVKFPPGLLL